MSIPLQQLHIFSVNRRQSDWWAWDTYTSWQFFFGKFSDLHFFEASFGQNLELSYNAREYLLAAWTGVIKATCFGSYLLPDDFKATKEEVQKTFSEGFHCVLSIIRSTGSNFVVTTYAVFIRLQVKIQYICTQVRIQFWCTINIPRQNYYCKDANLLLTFTKSNRVLFWRSWFLDWGTYR